MKRNMNSVQLSKLFKYLSTLPGSKLTDAEFKDQGFEISELQTFPNSPRVSAVTFKHNELLFDSKEKVAQFLKLLPPNDMPSDKSKLMPKPKLKLNQSPQLQQQSPLQSFDSFTSFGPTQKSTFKTPTMDISELIVGTIYVCQDGLKTQADARLVAINDAGAKVQLYWLNAQYKNWYLAEGRILYPLKKATTKSSKKRLIKKKSDSEDDDMFDVATSARPPQRKRAPGAKPATSAPPSAKPLFKRPPPPNDSTKNKKKKVENLISNDPLPSTGLKITDQLGDDNKSDPNVDAAFIALIKKKDAEIQKLTREKDEAIKELKSTKTELKRATKKLMDGE
tara:strand:- start:170 stop:1180 length:1011 start_codon:yes stop_codon:yes gene_type:complete